MNMENNDTETTAEELLRVCQEYATRPVEHWTIAEDWDTSEGETLDESDKEENQVPITDYKFIIGIRDNFRMNTDGREARTADKTAMIGAVILSLTDNEPGPDGYADPGIGGPHIEAIIGPTHGAVDGYWNGERVRCPINPETSGRIFVRPIERYEELAVTFRTGWNLNALSGGEFPVRGRMAGRGL